MPSITRRHLLAGLAGGSALGLTGYQLLPATLLPTLILEERTKRQSIPTVDTTLPVSPNALTESRDHLRGVIDRAEAAWEQVDESDVDSEHEEFDRNLESTIDTAREKLDEAERAAPTTETLRTLRHGVNRAAWSLGAARAIAEDYDFETLGEQSEALYSDVNDFADEMRYEVADPRRGLAFLHRTERGVYFARMKSHGRVYMSGEQPAESEYDHDDAVEAIRGAVEGRRWLGDARAIYEAHRANVAKAEAGETTDLEAHLDRTWKDCDDRIDSLLLDREAAIEQYFTDDEGARERATNELFNNGYSAADDAYSPSNGLRTGLLARTAVEHAKALQHALGFQSAMERLNSAFAEDEVGMAFAARIKREAVDRLWKLLAESDNPITRELVTRPREEIAIGDWSLGVNPQFDSEYPHAEASAMYLLAAENLRHTAEVRDALLP